MEKSAESPKIFRELLRSSKPILPNLDIRRFRPSYSVLFTVSPQRRRGLVLPLARAHEAEPRLPGGQGLTLCAQTLQHPQSSTSCREPLEEPSFSVIPGGNSILPACVRTSAHAGQRRRAKCFTESNLFLGSGWSGKNGNYR